MADASLEAWVRSLGIVDAAAITAVVQMFVAEGTPTPADAAGTPTRERFSESRLKTLLAGQKMHVRKKIYNGLLVLGGRGPNAAAASGQAPSPGSALGLSATTSTSPAAAAASPQGSPRPAVNWSTGDPALVKEIFELFAKDLWRMQRVEYAQFCSATEDGAGCDEKRWAAHNASMRKILANLHGPGGATPTPREDDTLGLTLSEFSMLYLAPTLKKHNGKAEEDLVLAKAATEALVEVDVFGSKEGRWGSGAELPKRTRSSGSPKEASPWSVGGGQDSRTLLVDGLGSMAASQESEEAVLRHFRSFGGLETDRSQLRPPTVSVVYADAMSAKKALFIGQSMVMVVSGHVITLSLASDDAAARSNAEKRRRV